MNNELLEVQFEPILENGALKVANKEVIDSLITKIIEEAHKEVVIQDDFDKKRVKDNRTQIGKRVEEIKRARLGIVRKFTSEFESTCKGYEKALNEVYVALGEKIRAYEESKSQTVKATLYEIRLKTTNTKFVEKLKKLAIENGVELEIKEK